MILGLLPGVAFAQAEQEQLVAIYGPLLAQCYEEAEGTEAQTQCIGTLALECMNTEGGGQTTMGMSLCNSTEGLFWDDLLNKEYKLTMAWAKDRDRVEAEYVPEYAYLANALRDAQRVWIEFRDAECWLAYAVWGSGSMRHIMGSACISDMSAERTIELRSMREEF